MIPILITIFMLVSTLSFAQGAPNASAGKPKYDQLCASCHGNMGKGDGPAAASLNPKPRNFTDAAYMGKRTDDQLKKVIKEGGAKNGLSPLMAPFGASLSDADIANIVAYIKTLK